MTKRALSKKTAKTPALYPEVIKVPYDTEVVCCDGGHPSLGHPKTFYRFDGQDYIECGYCDRRFERQSK